jgi:hypothetical protein
MVYYVAPPIGHVRRVAVVPAGRFMVPQRATADGETNVALTFDEESGTLRAAPKPETTTAENGAGLRAMPKDPDPEPPVVPPAPPEPEARRAQAETARQLAGVNNARPGSASRSMPWRACGDCR